MIKVFETSSSLYGATWEDNNLTIEFNSGKEYIYKNVPKVVVEEFFEAASAGQYFYKHIRSNYDCHLLEDMIVFE